MVSTLVKMTSVLTISLMISGCAGMSGGSGSSGVDNGNGIPSDTIDTDKALGAVNAVRASKRCGGPVAPLEWSNALYAAAAEHSVDMAGSGILQHDGTGGANDRTAKERGLKRGSYFFERINQRGYRTHKLSGELLLRGDKGTLSTPAQALAIWSRRHSDCKTLMDPRFKDVAMAKAISPKDGKEYWTLLITAGKD